MSRFEYERLVDKVAQFLSGNPSATRGEVIIAFSLCGIGLQPERWDIIIDAAKGNI